MTARECNFTLFQKVAAGSHAFTRDYLSTRYKCKQEYAWTRESVAAQLNSLRKSAWQLERATPLILKAYKPLMNQPLITDPLLNKLKGPASYDIARFVERSPAPSKLQKLPGSSKLGNHTSLPPDTLGLSPLILSDLSS